MAIYDCEAVQAVATIGEDIGAIPVPRHDSLPDTMSVEGIGSDRGGSGAVVIRDIPPLVRDIP